MNNDHCQLVIVHCSCSLKSVQSSKSGGLDDGDHLPALLDIQFADRVGHDLADQAAAVAVQLDAVAGAEQSGDPAGQKIAGAARAAH